jgi:hypothetical protein
MAKTLTVYLAADLKKFSIGMNQAETGLKGFANSLTNMLGPALIGAGVAAGAFATKLAVDGVQAAIEDEKAARALATTLENLNLAHDTAAVEDYITSMSKSTGVADDELRPAYDRLVRSIGDTQQANEALSLALDVSVGSGKSLEQVVEALGKAYDGNIAGLSRLGAGIDAATIRTGDMELITQKLADTFSGQAAAAAETFSGQIARASVAFDELKESFGYGFLQGLGDANGATGDFVDTMTELEPQLQAIGEELGNIAVELVKVTGATIDFNKRIQNANEAALADFSIGLVSLADRLGIVSDEEGEASWAAYELYVAQRRGTQAAKDMTDEMSRYVPMIRSAAVDTYKAAAAVNTFVEATGQQTFQVQAANKYYQDAAVRARDLAQETDKAAEAVTKLGGGSAKLSETLDETNPRLEAMRDRISDQLLALDGQVKSLERAEAALQSYAETVAKDILGEIDLGAVFDPANVQGSIDGFTKQIGDVTKFSDSVGKLAGELPNSPGAQLLLENILGMGYISGQAFIEGLTTETANNLVKELDSAATAIEGNSYLLANKFHGEGIEAGRQTILGMAAEIRDSEKKLRKIGQAIGKPIGADIKAEIAKAVAEAVAAAQAAGERARAEAVAREEARQASLTAQAVAQSLDRFIQDSNARAGRNVSPVLT